MRIAFAILLFPFALQGASPTPLLHLSNAIVAAARVSASGDIYVAGTLGDPALPDSQDAFVVRLAAGGSKQVYSVRIGGGKFDAATALEIDATGAAYIAGQTQSADFPSTAGVLQTKLESGTQQGFLVKLDPQGKVVFATLLGGTSYVYPVAGGLLVNAAGEIIVSGQTIEGSFPIDGGVAFTKDANTFFTLKLDAGATRMLGAVRGLGGRIALDEQGGIYIAGVSFGSPTPIPVTPGAFQSSFETHACFGTGQLAFGCSYQYVAKLNAAMTQLIYATYVTGSYGATAAAIFVDAQHTVTVAGTTFSPDYPTTSNAFEPYYIANAPPPPQTCLFGCVFPPPASGFLTKLNATGTGLLYSTFFSGSLADTITFAAGTPDGIFLSGQATSPDLPALEGYPAQCLPRNFATRLSPDGSQVTAARAIPGNALAWQPSTKSLIVWTGTDLLAVDPAAPPSGISCILDGLDMRPVTAIAPGELLSIFGPHFAINTGAQDVPVKFNGIPGALMYVSPRQINVQAPFEIAGSPDAVVTVLSESSTLGVVARNPVAFLDTAPPPSVADCRLNGLGYNGGPLPLAFNPDGSRNTCSTPAPAGSIVRLYLAGLGVTSPPQATGAITPAPGVPLNLTVAVAASSPGTVVSAIAAPGLISGVWQIDLRLPVNQTGAIPISFTVEGVPVRDTGLIFWVR